MLRITTHEKPESLTFQLEGKLAGLWVEELEKCWHDCGGRRQGERPICFDLTGLTSVDGAGKEFLAARRGEGVELVAAGCFMKSIVAEVTQDASQYHR
jgi:hypothetical protein